MVSYRRNNAPSDGTTTMNTNAAPSFKTASLGFFASTTGLCMLMLALSSI